MISVANYAMWKLGTEDFNGFSAQSGQSQKTQCHQGHRGHAARFWHAEAAAHLRPDGRAGKFRCTAGGGRYK